MESGKSRRAEERGADVRLIHQVPPTLKGEHGLSSVSGERESLELCEECGSPLVGGFCELCIPGRTDGSSPVGAAPLDRRELSRVLGRSVGAKAHGSYALSIQQEAGMAPLRKEIDSLVERFNASAEVKRLAKQNAEKLAVKLMDDLGPTRAAIVSVAQFFIAQGRNFAEVSFCISLIHPAMDRLGDIMVEVYPEPTGEIRVLVDGRDRAFKSYSNGIYRKLRIPLFVSDSNSLFELRNARLTQAGYDTRKVEPVGPSKFRAKTDERNFELFKVIEEARLSGKIATGATDIAAMLRRYSVSKLPLTQRLLREAGLIQQVTAEYARLLTREIADGRGRSPRRLAEEALVEACERVVPSCLSSSISQKYHLRQSAVRSLVVLSELAEWQRRAA
jgi:hypothetical protein